MSQCNVDLQPASPLRMKAAVTESGVHSCQPMTARKENSPKLPPPGSRTFYRGEYHQQPHNAMLVDVNKRTTNPLRLQGETAIDETPDFNCPLRDRVDRIT